MLQRIGHGNVNRVEQEQVIVAADDAEQLHERIDEVLTRVDSTADEPDAGQRARMVESEIKALESMADRSPPVLYALGYAWYFHPDRIRSPEIQSRVEMLLQSVLEAKPDDFLSLLCLWCEVARTVTVHRRCSHE